MGALSGKLRMPANVEELEEEDFRAAEERLEELSDEQRKELAETAGLFPEGLVESEVGLVPEGWGVVQVGSLIDNIRNQVDPTTLDTSLPYVGLEHIGRKSLTLADWGISTEVESNKSRFDSGNILFGKLRPYFHKVCVAPFSGICSTDVLVLAAKDEVYTGFATHLIFTEGFVDFANRASTGTRMPRAKWAHMKTFPVCCPPVEVALKFNAMHGSVSRLSTSLVEETVHLRDLRDSLLPRLISGELSVEGVGG